MVKKNKFMTLISNLILILSILILYGCNTPNKITDISLLIDKNNQNNKGFNIKNFTNINSNANYSDSIGYQQEKRYSFSMVSGRTYTVRLTPSSGDPDLYTSNSSSLSRTNCQASSTSGTGSVDSVTFTAPFTGTNYVLIYGYSASNYTLNISDPVNTSTGDSRNESSNINANSSREVTEFISPGEREYWLIDGIQNHTYRISMEKIGNSSLDTYLELKNPDGNVIASDDDSGEGTNSLLEGTFTRTGTYTIVARGYNSSSTGAYKLKINSHTSILSTIRQFIDNILNVRNIDLRYNVPLYGQSPYYGGCWIASTRMLLKFHNIDTTMDRIYQAVYGGDLNIASRTNNEGLSWGDEERLRQFGMRVVGDACYTQEGWYNLLSSNGPLIIIIWPQANQSVNSRATHAIVLTGMSGNLNGSPTMYVNDPGVNALNGSMTNYTFESFTSQYEITGYNTNIRYRIFAVNPSDITFSPNAPANNLSSDIQILSGGISSYISQGELKKYAIRTNSGTRYTVRLTPTNQNSDPDLYVSNSQNISQNNFESSSLRSAGLEDSVTIIGNGGYYYIAVYGYSSAGFQLSYN